MTTFNPLPEVYDNVCVRRGKQGASYFALGLKQPDPARGVFHSVYISRYVVPGRCDEYAFRWMPNSDLDSAHLRYDSEYDSPLPKILKMAEIDLDKPQVTDMFLRGFQSERVVLHYRHDLLRLLRQIAPKSKTYRKLTRHCEKMMEKRAQRIEREKAAKDSEK